MPINFKPPGDELLPAVFLAVGIGEAIPLFSKYAIFVAPFPTMTRLFILFACMTVASQGWAQIGNPPGPDEEAVEEPSIEPAPVEMYKIISLEV